MDKRDKTLEEIDKDLEKVYTEYKEDMLNHAYEESQERYNELFDEIQRREREIRKKDGSYTVDDFLDDLEDRRDRIQNHKKR